MLQKCFYEDDVVTNYGAFLQEKCHQYWPAERSARYQYFVVDPMAEYNMPQYILREFKVTDARVRWSAFIKQIKMKTHGTGAQKSKFYP